jgi:AAA family ATP:ADP antiporter
MSRQNKLLAVFNIEAGEGRLVALLLLYSFFIGCTRLLVNTSAGTLLRDRFGEQAAQYLPYIYIGAAIVAPLIGFLYARLQGRLSFSKLLATILGFLLISLALIYILLVALPQAKWPAIVFYIWYYVLYALIMLAFWGLAAHLLDIRQSKRLFSLVGSGLVVAMIISGFLVGPLARLVGVSNLLLLAAGGLIGCLFLLFYITHTFHTDQPAEPVEETAQAEKQSYTDLVKNRYILLMVAVTILNLVAYYFVDIAFYDQVYLRFPQTDELAGFLGTFLAVSSLLNLGSRTLATGKLISRHGLLIGLLILPSTLIVNVLAVAVLGTILGITAVVFWLVVITRLLFRTLDGAVDKSAFSVLYQAIPTRQRLQAQTFIISIIEPVAGGLAGVVLLLLSFGTVQISYALLFILAVWIGFVILVGWEYKAVLVQTLSKSKMGEVSLDVIDKSSMAILEQQLKSPYPGVVVYALNMLETTEHEALPRILREAVSHPEPEVRQDALVRIERLGFSSMMRSVRLRIKFETSIPVQATAIRTLVKLADDDDVLDEIAPYLDNANPEIRMGAMVGLLRNGGVEGILLAGEKLIRQVDSPDAAEREFAARTLGEVGQPSFYRPLLKLLQDDDWQVRRTALAAAGRLQNRKLWPLVLENVAQPEVRTAAVLSLIAGGESVSPVLKKVFADRERSPEFLTRVARICGQIGGDRITDLLQEQLTFPDKRVRHQILLSLSRCGYRAQGEQIAVVEQQIDAEIENAAWIVAALIDVGEHETVALLPNALLDEFKQTRIRIFLLLSFVYPAQVVLSARDNLIHGSQENKAYALEVIDNTLTAKDKARFLPLIEDRLPLAQRLERVEPHLAQPPLNLEQHQRLREIVARPAEWIGHWSRACALQAMAQWVELNAVEQPATEAATDTIIATLSDSNPLLREIAVWSLFKLDSVTSPNYIRELAGDPNPRVAGLAQQLLVSENGDIAMPSTIEKVLILKSVDIFAEVPEEILARVAANLKEVNVAQGETIFAKGDIGRNMYIIVKGRVRVHDEAQTFGYLSERDIFGEYSALDTEPRSASVTAVEDTSFFRLDQDVLYELMGDNVEVAWGIIQVLTRRLRALNKSEDKHYGEPAEKPETKPKSVLMDGILGKLAEGD